MTRTVTRVHKGAGAGTHACPLEIAVNTLLAVLNRFAAAFHIASQARLRAPLSAFLNHEERGGPAPL
ncbi:MAG: hypothetical protein U0229_14450 [Anaeromyxobacter sp.]